ncbi:putative protein [Clostridiales bacterium]|nr:putative protein [Clostridiales bacterium]
MKRIAIILLFVMTMICTGCSSQTAPQSTPAGTEQNQEVNENSSFPYTFTDIQGREVTVEKKPETFIVGNYILNFMLVGGRESLDKVIGMPLDGWEETRFGEYTSMTKSFPEILDKLSIGGYHDDVLDAELILTQKPDVLLINTSQYTENETSVPIFENAGINVVVIDYHKMKVENHVKSTEILGVLLGREDVADEMIKDYTSAVEMVESRIANEEKNVRKVYMELGNNGVGEYGNSYAGMLWGPIITNAGGKNIAEDIIDGSGYSPLDKEYVISQNPDIIIIGGSTWNGGDDQMRMGLTIDSDLAQEKLTGFMSRAGWEKLKAVKNGEIYGVDHGSLRFMGDYVYNEAIAKMIYPELFEDIDPQKEMESFYEKYLPEMDYTGTFYIKWNK